MNSPLVLIAALLALAVTSEARAVDKTFRNPVNPSADPWMAYVKGHYYLATTQGDRIKLWKAKSVASLAEAQPITIWEGGQGVWAPEFHELKGPRGTKWYCYFTMTDGPDDNHRMYVMESASGRIEGPYRAPKKILTDPKDEFYAIDGSVFVHPNGKTYFFWAARPHHRLYVAEMSDPWTLKGERQLIEASGFGCEEVREGPFVIQHGNRLFLTYSACDTAKPDYKVGALWTTIDEDPLDPKSWRQIETPILERADENGVFGPGHHSFFKSPDGKEDWIAYHAKTSSEYTYRGRSTRLQKLEWTEDGMPKPVIPLPLDAEIPLPSGDRGR